MPSDEHLLRLQRLRALINHNLSELVPCTNGSADGVQAAMRYALLSPGKRVRPILALLSAEHLGCSAIVAMPVACALELVHAASLVLDDLPCMDNAGTRRGLPSVHVRFGENIAILTGIALLNMAFSVLARSPSIDAEARAQMIGVLAHTVGTEGLVAGQESDLQRRDSLNFGSLSQLHHQKTGVLFIASVEMGALAAGATPSIRNSLRYFAQELGLAFQALDDLEDEPELAEIAEPSSNMLTMLSKADLRHEASRRLSRAKAALTDAGPPLSPIGAYVDLLLGHAHA